MAILFPDSLPVPGLAVESATLEFKRELDSPFDGAKQVAALANARGGALIFGVIHNQQTGQLVKYASIDVGKTDEVLSQAIKERCSPAPSYLASAREYEGQNVLLVSVEPSLSGAVVGVRVKSADPDHKGPAWVFPVRVGSQTKYLDPGELPMYVDARLRRAVVLLGQIGGGDRVALIAERTTMGGNHPMPIRGFITGINEGANVFSVGSMSLPLDRIESVYKDTSEWTIVYRFFGPANLNG